MKEYLLFIVLLLFLIMIIKIHFLTIDLVITIIEGNNKLPLVINYPHANINTTYELNISNQYHIVTISDLYDR